MKELLMKNTSDFIDLYHNDMIGLKKTLDQLQNEN